MKFYQRVPRVQVSVINLGKSESLKDGGKWEVGWGLARKLNFEPGLIEMKNKFSKVLAA